MSVTKNNMPELAGIIVNWLEYQNLLGKRELFSESYLNQPIGEFLLHYRDSKKSHLKTEYNHPILNLIDRKGRPYQVDFLMKSMTAITVAIEMKWFVHTGNNTNNSRSINRIIYDLLRLEILHGYKKSHNDDIKNMVSNLKTKVFICASTNNDMEELAGDSNIREFLSFDQDNEGKDINKDINIDNLTNESKKIVKEWLDKFKIPNGYVPDDNNDWVDINHFYKNNELKISKEFQTTLVAKATIGDFHVCIWRVHSGIRRRAKRTSSNINLT